MSTLQASWKRSLVAGVLLFGLVPERDTTPAAEKSQGGRPTAPAKQAAPPAKAGVAARPVAPPKAAAPPEEHGADLAPAPPRRGHQLPEGFWPCQGEDDAGWPGARVVPRRYPWERTPPGRLAFGGLGLYFKAGP